MIDLSICVSCQIYLFMQQMFLNQQLSSFATHWWWREANFLCTQRERRVVLMPLCTLFVQFIVPFVFLAHANYASISATACLFACLFAHSCLSNTSSRIKMQPHSQSVQWLRLIISESFFCNRFQNKREKNRHREELVGIWEYFLKKIQRSLMSKVFFVLFWLCLFWGGWWSDEVYPLPTSHPPWGNGVFLL